VAHLGPLSEYLREGVIHTLYLETACCMLRVFHHCCSEMSVAIFKTSHFFALFYEDGILFQSSTTLFEKKISSHFQSGWLEVPVPYIVQYHCVGLGWVKAGEATETVAIITITQDHPGILSVLLLTSFS
jgi:hypothetical protein